MRSRSMWLFEHNSQHNVNISASTSVEDIQIWLEIIKKSSNSEIGLVGGNRNTQGYLSLIMQVKSIKKQKNS